MRPIDQRYSGNGTRIQDERTDAVFGMRNFLSHEYGEVDAEAIFGTIKYDLPPLLDVTRQMLADMQVDSFLGAKMKRDG